MPPGGSDELPPAGGALGAGHQRSGRHASFLAGDDPANRDLLEAALRERGWEVTAVDDSEGAEAHFRAAPAALVVLALANGIEVCRRIRGDPSAAATQLLLVAADAAVLPPEAAASGADDLLLLPISPAELHARFSLAAARSERAQAARRASEERYYRFFEDDLSGDFISTPEGRILECNDALARILGFESPDALKRADGSSLYPTPAAREEFLDLLRREGRVERHELELRRRDGVPVHVVENVIGRFDERGELIEFHGYVFDITERKHMEEELRQSEQRYRALFDQSPLGIFLCDQDLQITHFNHRLLELLDASPEQVVGLRLTELRDRRVLPAIQQALAGQPASYEGPYLPLLISSELWISAHSSPLRDARGQVIGAIIVLEDVTARKQAEALLQQQAEELQQANAELQRRTQEAERAMQARTRLYARLHHELRTPLSAIILYNDLLLDGALGALTPEQQGGVERSQEAARHLLDLVQEALDLSQIEAGRVVLHPVRVSLPELVDDVLAMVQPLASSRGSELRVERIGTAFWLHTDPGRLRQILFNLLSNAVKLGRSRPITLRCRSSAGDEAVLEVIDQGEGIAEEDLPHIFEEFVQLRAPDEEGSGLGLAISRHLAHLLGGRLEVESVTGQGSTFRLVLPLHPPATSTENGGGPAYSHD